MRPLIALLAVLFAVSARAGPWPKPGDLVTNTGKTKSMGNVFPPGATARLLAVENPAAIVGFVVYMKDEVRARGVCHRCIATGIALNGKRWFITRGDANIDRDPVRWSESQLLGVLDLPRKP